MKHVETHLQAILEETHLQPMGFQDTFNTSYAAERLTVVSGLP